MAPKGLLAIGLFMATLDVAAQSPRKVTIDDLMALRTISDVKISPAGDLIAYTVSTPSVSSNTHEAALFVIPARGGTPKRLADGYKLHTPALPAPRIRWRSDGQSLSVLIAEKTGPQVLTIRPDNSDPQVVTAAPLGVSAYEWSRDGQHLAFLTRDAGPPTPPIANTVGAKPSATRLWVQPVNPPGPARVITAADRYVDSFSWSPDSKEIAYSWAPVVGFLAPYQTKISAVAVEGGATRPIVDRAGMNVSPQFSPDGTRIAFVSTGERTGIIAPRGLVVADASGRNANVRAYPMNGAWIAEILWTPDSQALYVTMNEGTFATGAHMFEMPVVRDLTDGGELMAEYYGLPWENPEGYARSSPLTHAARVTTPILISHGDRDPRVPLATAQKFFKALQAHGKTAEMDIYPRGGHVFYEPQQEKAVMTRNFEWMTRFIKP